MSENTVIASVIAISIVECTALVLGYDGAILTAVVGVLAGLGGYRYAQYRAKRRG